MPKHIAVAADLSPAELERRYRQATDAVLARHLHLIWLLAQGKRTTVVVEATGYSPTWIRTLARRYNRDGVAGLGDRRHQNPGGAALLPPEQQDALRQALAQPPPDGGLWNSRKVADWIAARLGRPVRPLRGWVYLRRLGYTRQVPRPRHAKADAQAQEAFKKSAGRAGGRTARGQSPDAA